MATTPRRFRPLPWRPGMRATNSYGVAGVVVRVREDKLTLAVENADGEVELHDILCATALPVEYILCAAIHVDDGVEHPHQAPGTPTGLVFCGHRHHNCFTPLLAWADRLTPEEREKIGEEELRGRHQGFLTSKGRFVGRAEGLQIARAAGQVTTTIGSILTSEDLW